jgi:hypothetical protein
LSESQAIECPTLRKIFRSIENHAPVEPLRVRTFLTLLFVSSLIDGSPDSNRMIVLADNPALFANSTLRNPNFTRRVFHQSFEELINQFDTQKPLNQYK